MVRQDTVYLLHFDEPYKHARHYLGYTGNLELRVAEHRNGTGARLMRAVVEAGISFVVARTWEGDRAFERRLKQRGSAVRLCPICSPGNRCAEARR